MLGSLVACVLFKQTRTITEVGRPAQGQRRSSSPHIQCITPTVRDTYHGRSVGTLSLVSTGSQARTTVISPTVRAASDNH